LKKETNKTKVKQYMLWMEEGADDASYWQMYDSLEDAVSEGGDGCHVYLCEPKYIGRYKRKAEIVKIKRLKKKR